CFGQVSDLFSINLYYILTNVWSVWFISLTMKMATHYQQCTPMIYKSSLPSHSAKRLSCIGSDPLYCTSMTSGVWMSAQGQGDQVCVQGYLGFF
ncbi:hypothetical protein Bpfe_021077, partial [Biomphalaria pfeifferi]